MNYRRFFALFATADAHQRAIMAVSRATEMLPCMPADLEKKCVEDVRKKTLAVLSRAYMALPLQACAEFLGFSVPSKDQRGIEPEREAEEWLLRQGFAVDAGVVPLRKRRHK